MAAVGRRRWIFALVVPVGGLILRTGQCWPTSSFLLQGRRFSRDKAQHRHDRRSYAYRARLSEFLFANNPGAAARASAQADLPDVDGLDYETLEAGILPDHKIVKEYSLVSYQRHGFDGALQTLVASRRISDGDARRLNLTGSNVTVPVALMIVDPDAYPSLSRARKACRKRSIVMVRGNNVTIKSRELGLVGDRVVLAEEGALQVQQRFGTGYFALSPSDAHDLDAASMKLPVLYEDDYVAIVNKPAGLLVHRAPQSSPSCPTTRAMLPRCLVPPARGTLGALSRPVPVHRLDKPTSGCLVVAKTKPALVALGRSFHDRTVQKTYTALVSGKLPTSSDAWSVIDEPLEGKEAITHWRVLSESPCAFALDQTLSLVEMKPTTGRFHQLRRHMALVMGKPLVGDDDYDGNSPHARRLRHRGLCLCATSITVPHPWYNTPQGRHEYRRRFSAEVTPEPSETFRDGGSDAGYVWWDDRGVRGGAEDGAVMITARVHVPAKFHALMAHERERFLKFHAQETDSSVR